MTKMDMTKLSSKGQIVIPSSMREGMKEGDTFMIIREGSSIILKKTNDLDENFKEELEFARRTEEAYKRHERGDFKKMSSDKFLEELEKW